MYQSALTQFSHEHQLTPREQEILHRMVIAGMTNKEIAELMVISDKTVKNHIANMYAKCGVGNFRQLIAMIFSREASPEWTESFSTPFVSNW
ncbi:response regulator transcription factor [Gorillibacterium sp. sgz5001074]|uniref:response regulator transcription factor n=1 Tax=Gorillibacterium sp. sgz5001074 TaxID=3446695 RepID=UPI003F6614CE